MCVFVYFYFFITQEAYGISYNGVRSKHVSCVRLGYEFADSICCEYSALLKILSEHLRINEVLVHAGNISFNITSRLVQQI